MPALKKYFFAVCFSMLLTAGLAAQSFGVSAYGLVFFSKGATSIDRSNYGEREMGHTSPVTPGVRIEGNYILPGFGFPVSGFNGLGFSYFFPHSDSAFFQPELENGGYRIDVLGTRRTSMQQINFRFGYEIPQTFNDFLMLHFGWGMGYMRSKSEYRLPDQSATFNYTYSDFKAPTFEPVKKGQFALELLFGGIYEFEHFSALAQYSVIAGISGGSGGGFRHGLNLGVYYPLKQL